MTITQQPERGQWCVRCQHVCVNFAIFPSGLNLNMRNAFAATHTHTYSHTDFASCVATIVTVKTMDFEWQTFAFVDLVLARDFCWQYTHLPSLLLSSSFSFTIIIQHHLVCLCIFSAALLPLFIRTRFSFYCLRRRRLFSIVSTCLACHCDSSIVCSRIRRTN